jgi:hypothetical protein
MLLMYHQQSEGGRMATLAQIIAVRQTVKANTKREQTDAYHLLKKPELLSGISRTYQPKDEEGEQLPPESKMVQVKTRDVLDKVAELLTRYFDITATVEYANTVAKADLVVGGKKILTDVPVTYLLFLEKELVDVRTELKALPVLDPAESWHFDDNVDAYTSEPAKTMRTQKVYKNHVLSDATKEHPAQVQVFTEDVPVGTWTRTLFSGAIPAKERNAMIERVDALIEAVKLAREAANATPVKDEHVGKAIFDYLLKA